MSLLIRTTLFAFLFLITNGCVQMQKLKSLFHKLRVKGLRQIDKPQREHYKLKFQMDQSGQ